MAETTSPATEHGPPAARRPVLTEDVGRFVKHLRAGDVLLFDSLHVLSNLVKLAENRPVSHAAVFLGDDTIAHVLRHKPDPDPDKPPLVPAARTEQLSTRLLGPTGRADRTVTAMRHQGITKASRAGVVEVARAYTDSKRTVYDYASLLVLMVPSLMRSYGGSEAGDDLIGMVGGTMGAIGHSIAAAFVEADEEGGGHGPTLTCSEFVYRCFVEADPKLSIEITQPIGWWMDPDALRTPPTGGPDGGGTLHGGNPDETPVDGPPEVRGGGGGDGGGGDGGGGRFALPDRFTIADDGGDWPGDVGGFGAAPFDGTGQVVDGGGLVMFDNTFRSGILTTEPLADMTVGVTGWRGARGLGWDLALLAGQRFMDQVNSNRDKGKYREDPTVATGELSPDAVTPRDLWSSPSLSTVAVLHLPPGPLDKTADPTI